MANTSPRRHVEVEVLEQRRRRLADGQIAHLDDRASHAEGVEEHGEERVDDDSANRLVTTAEVVARPTPSAPPRVARPRWQAISATLSAKTTLFSTPETTSHSVSAFCVSSR